mmetsp:Transcript_20656/g.41328  ORF Transcript_20656/g.41328 Transcript_20656/m.41328 type:complete len:409 (-) Transcript_20656:120-1346(-)
MSYPDSDVLEALLGFKNKAYSKDSAKESEKTPVVDPIIRKNKFLADATKKLNEETPSKMLPASQCDSTRIEPPTTEAGIFLPTEMRSELLPPSSAKSELLTNDGQKENTHRRLPLKNQMRGSRKNPISIPVATNFVRKDEVELALKSKPQRGKKRENLSALERLALTRTRNREHAKSTRLRKKARYQELLDKEEQLQNLMRQDQLRDDRRKSIIAFMNLRSEAIKNGPTSCQGFVPAALDLGNLIESPKSFRFVIVESTGSEIRRTHSIGTSALVQNDRAVASSVIDTFGESALSLLCLRVVGGEGGVGLTADGAFAQYHISVEHPDSEDGDTVLEGVVRVNFSDGSHRMTSMELWSTSIAPGGLCGTFRRAANNVPYVSSDCLSTQGTSGSPENEKSTNPDSHPFEV